jgi:hypothetical protein
MASAAAFEAHAYAISQEVAAAGGEKAQRNHPPGRA